MIKKIALKVTATVTPVPTGLGISFRPLNTPADSTRPAKSVVNRTSVIESANLSGVNRNPPKPKPHILKGWEKSNA